MRFVGVDLAWSPQNPTAAVELSWSGSRATLARWRVDLGDDASIVDFVAAGAPGVVTAIDGPLQVSNATGIRACDALVNAAYRRYNAGVHPANRGNLGRYGGLRGEEIVRGLEDLGIPLAVPTQPRVEDDGCFECYPHAALVSLFRLARILPYKARGLKRPLDVRWRAFGRLKALLRGLRRAEPALQMPEELLRHPRRPPARRSLKSQEDLLDAVVCAYTALHAWYWGPEGYALFGDLRAGHILVPLPMVGVAGRGKSR